MSNEQQPIPVFQRIVCPTCGRKGVSEVGRQVICETCVNEFLAKNVGLMQPDNTPPPTDEKKEFDIEDFRIDPDNLPKKRGDG